MEEVIARIEALDEQGVGLASHEGWTILVADAAAGDRLRLRIVHRSPHRPRAWAEIVEILEPSPSRRQPPCRQARQAGGGCGGCPLMHLSDEAQRAFKAERASVERLRSPARRLGYRHRSHFRLARGTAASLIVGSYAPRSNEVVSMQGCLVVREAIARVAARAAEVLADAPLYPSEPQGLRALTLRSSPADEVLLDLVLAASEMPAWLAAKIEDLAAIDEVVGLSWSAHEQPGNAVRGSRAPQLLRGRARVEEPVGALGLELGVASFSQLHSDVAAEMYAQAAAWAQPAASMLDLYCGVGGLGLTIASAMRPRPDLVGLESLDVAVARARGLAGAAGRYEVHDLERGLGPWAEHEAQLIVVNPPRRGLSSALREELARHGSAGQLLYMSCSVSSLARDLEQLERHGWHELRREAFDMLPHTRHVELLVDLRRLP